MLLKDEGIPIPHMSLTGGEVHFMKPERDYRFDACWYAFEVDADADEGDGGVAIELDGAVFQSGRHTRGVGFTQDTVKVNEAALRGWIVLRYPTHVIQRWPKYVINQIQRAFLYKLGVRVGKTPLKPLTKGDWPHSKGE